MDLTSIGTTVKDVGFPVAAAACIGWLCYKLITRSLDRAETRLDAKEKECADERNRFEARLDEKSRVHAEDRKADREAHLEKLGAIGGKLDALGDNVRELVRRRVAGE